MEGRATRRRRLAALVVVGATAAAFAVRAGVIARARSTEPAPADDEGPGALRLCVERRGAGALGPPLARNDHPFAAAARSLDATERRALAAALSAAGARWTAEVNPTVDDLEDDGAEPRDLPLTTWLATAPRPLRTAVAAARRERCAPDGFCVRVVPDGICTAGWSRPSAAEGARARFLAGVWGGAVRVRVLVDASAAPPGAAWGALRRAARRPGSALGLVLTADDHEAGDEAEEDESLREVRASYTRWRALRAVAAQPPTAAQDANRPAAPSFADALERLVDDPREALVLPPPTGDGRVLRGEITAIAGAAGAVVAFP